MIVGSMLCRRVRKYVGGKNDYRIIYVLLATQFAIPFISIALLQQRFGFALHTIYYHMLLVGAANLAWLVGALLVCWTLSSRIRTFARYLLCLFLGGFSVLLFFTHLLAWGGEMKFGYYISFNMLIPFLTHLGSTVETLPVPSLVVWTILVIIPAATLIFYAAMAPSLFAFLQRSIASLHENKRELYNQTERSPLSSGRRMPGSSCCLHEPQMACKKRAYGKKSR